MDNDIFARWKEGQIGPQEALRALCMDLGEVESELDPLAKQREFLRANISEVVLALDGKAEVKGFGQMQLTEPSRVISYDGRELDRLVAQLVAEGNGALAERLTACRKESARAGSLRINREKAPKA